MTAINPDDELAFFDDLATRLDGSVVLAPRVSGRPNFKASPHKFRRAPDGDLSIEDVDRLAVLTRDFHCLPGANTQHAGTVVVTRLTDAGAPDFIPLSGPVEDREAAVAYLRQQYQAPRRRKLVAANDNAGAATATTVTAIDLPFFDPGEWQGVPVPDRTWYVDGLIPSRTVTLLSGDGGLGKSLLALQLASASALCRDMLGISPAACRVCYVGAEDEPDEFHRRLGDILKSSGSSFSDLSDRFLLLPLADRDAVLAAPDRTGKMQPTALFSGLVEKIRAFRPGLVVLDTSADLFGGDEIKRAQVRQFVALLRAMAMEVDCAVLLLSHPSVSGMQSGTGTSGSTAWSNSVRSRLYLTRPGGEDADPDIRLLTSMKSNYGRVGDVLRLRWQDGIFVVDDGSVHANPAIGVLNKSDDRTFMAILSKFNQQGQRVGASTGTTYAPAKMAKHPDAKGTTKQRLERAMQRLIEADEIRLIWEGPPSRQRQRLVVSADDFSAGQSAYTA